MLFQGVSGGSCDLRDNGSFFPKSTFIREDFPAFGFPKITVLMPSDMTRPSSQEAKSRSTCFTIGSKAAKGALDTRLMKYVPGHLKQTQ